MSGEPRRLDPELRALLVCPVCRGDLDDVEGGLRCPTDRLVYPIVDGIPWMVREHAKRDDAEAKA